MPTVHQATWGLLRALATRASARSGGSCYSRALLKTGHGCIATVTGSGKALPPYQLMPMKVREIFPILPPMRRATHS